MRDAILALALALIGGGATYAVVYPAAMAAGRRDARRRRGQP